MKSKLLAVRRKPSNLCKKRKNPSMGSGQAGLVYRDDFESYKSGFDLKMSPEFTRLFDTHYCVKPLIC